MVNDQILNPVQSDGSSPSLAFFGGQFIWNANPDIVEKLDEVGALMRPTKHHYTATCTAGATRRRSSTAPPRSGSSSMDKAKASNQDKAARPCASPRSRHRRDRFFPAWGQARLHAMIANRPDWTLSRQRQWGVPMPFFLHKETGELHPRTVELLEQVASGSRRAASKPGRASPPRTCSATKAAPPFNLSPTLLGAILVTYLAGAVAVSGLGAPSRASGGVRSSSARSRSGCAARCSCSCRHCRPSSSGLRWRRAAGSSCKPPRRARWR